MPSLNEINEIGGTPLGEALAAGLKDITYHRGVVFTRYRRQVLPSDGFVFWVATGETKNVSGAVHATTGSETEEDQSFDQSTIILTTEGEVHQFHDMELDEVWVGDFEGVKFAISSRSSRFTQSGLFHYLGTTVLPAFESQFVDDPAALEERGLVVSSSLPIFLAMPSLSSIALSWCPWPENVPVFPSFAVPDNIPPPYIVVHNDPGGGQSESMGFLDPNTGSTSRLMRERVRLRTYGLDHMQADNLLNYITRWALLHPDTIGITNSPHIRDEKTPLAAINALAMAKTIELDVMYAQDAARHTAIQLIQHVVPTVQRSS